VVIGDLAYLSSKLFLAKGRKEIPTNKGSKAARQRGSKVQSSKVAKQQMGGLESISTQGNGATKQ
jgi:hypothetical protein